MKHLSVLFILLTIFICSCSSDDDTSPPPSVVQTPDPESTTSTQYTLTVTDGEGGYVSTQGGTYDEGTEITVKATPHEGYVFSGWSNGSTQNPLSIVFNANLSLSASFETDFTLVTPEYFTLEAKIYSIYLSYTNNEEATNVKIYKGYCENELMLVETISSQNNYIDNSIGFTQDVYYKISFVNSKGVESNFSEIKSLSGLEPLNTVKAQNATSRPIGVHYADYYFESDRFTRIKQRFTIHELPTVEYGGEYDGGLFWNFYNGVINDDIGFYFGIQTLVGGDPDGIPSKGLIFSRWKTRDITNYRLVKDGWGQNAGYEGDFISIRKEFEWEVGTYEIELKVVDSDDIGDWYGLFLRSIESPDFIYFGSIRFEHGVNKGIMSGSGSWTEIYSANSSLEFPRWHISIDDIKINNQEQPKRIQSRYFEEVWQSNQFDDYTNIFSPDGKQIHFLMGPYVKRYHNSGNIVTLESISKNLCHDNEDLSAEYNPTLNIN